MSSKLCKEEELILSFLSRQTLIFIILILLGIQEIGAYQKKSNSNPSIFISNKLWNKVQDYLIPNNHPIKKKLDHIFSQSRVIADLNSLQAAGFSFLMPQHNTQIIVARHPDLNGYILKLYLDNQNYFKDRPEHFHWMERINGVRLIRRYITKHHYENFFKTPKKWMYLLPDDPFYSSQDLGKKFILVAEDMELFEDNVNELMWGGPRVNKEFLYAFYKIVTDLGLRDSTKPSNCTFSIDGKASFIDTQVYEREDVKYDILTPFLSPTMQEYWKKLIFQPPDPPLEPPQELAS